MIAPAIWTSPACKFAAKRPGTHKPLVRGNEASGWVCENCLIEMQASYRGLFSNQATVFCHNCGTTFGAGDIYVFVYRQNDAMILCERCNAAHIAKIAGEQAAIADEKAALIIHSVDARTAIAEATDREVKQTLYQRFKELYGSLRRLK